MQQNVKRWERVRDVGSIQKVGGTCIQGYPHKQKVATF